MHKLSMPKKADHRVCSAVYIYATQTATSPGKPCQDSQYNFWPDPAAALWLPSLTRGHAMQIQEYIVNPSKKDAAAFGRLSKPASSPFLEGFLTNEGYA